MMTTDREFSLLRDGTRDLVFTGQQIGYFSSPRLRSERWLELWIYRTTRPQDRYVLAGLGGTTLDGEVDRHWAKMLRTPAEVLRQLVRVDVKGQEYLTITAEDVLSDAAKTDPEFSQALLDWYESARP